MESIPDSEIPIEKVLSATPLLLFDNVSDAAANSTSGVSLDDNLMLGPKVQKDLFQTLTRF